jgi:putative DNA methylase
MTRGGVDSPVSPVDLSQAIIGPGMAVFSKYSAVLEADGTPVTVKTALQLINKYLAEDAFDSGTQFAVHWFERHGWEQGSFGEADVLARAKTANVGYLAEAGVLISGAGKVQLLRPGEFLSDWDSKRGQRASVWEGLHRMIVAFQVDGESGAGLVLADVWAKSDGIRQLAYRLYTLCERRGWADDARGYDEIIKSWPYIEKASRAIPGLNEQIEMVEDAAK